ncbi:hypothetical protein [Haladaptatus sp. DFWS20]|uniref:hypothetical protein n=1 Tax=Haladaptatus sp. DFWS20 TaxID=3403467 RepID=UPI003EBDD044
MTGLDWSTRYLSLGAASTAGTVAMWHLDSTHVLSIALLTAVGFATLALFHARHLRKYSLP